MRRVGLQLLPATLVAIIPSLRRRVRERMGELLCPPPNEAGGS
jgi:hypothetical protein